MRFTESTWIAILAGLERPRVVRRAVFWAQEIAELVALVSGVAAILIAGLFLLSLLGALLAALAGEPSAAHRAREFGGLCVLTVVLIGVGTFCLVLCCALLEGLYGLAARAWAALVCAGIKRSLGVKLSHKLVEAIVVSDLSRHEKRQFLEYAFGLYRQPDVHEERIWGLDALFAGISHSQAAKAEAAWTTLRAPAVLAAAMKGYRGLSGVRIVEGDVNETLLEAGPLAARKRRA